MNKLSGYLRGAMWTYVCAVLVANSVPSAAADETKTLGFVSPISAATASTYYAPALISRLWELGWLEGKNLVVVRGYADGDHRRLPAVVKEVLASHPDVVVAPGTQAAMATMQATTTVPIVSLMGDPVGSGLVASLARPGGNLTGVSAQNTEEMPGKWIELLREMVPRLSKLAVIVNPDNAMSKRFVLRLDQEASTNGMKVLELHAAAREDFAGAFERARREVQAVVVMPDAMAVHSREVIAALAKKHRMPALYGQAEFVEAGGLISYGPELVALWRRMADYADKIFRGAKPADLPIEQPLTFELAVNLNAARAIGLTVPQSILLRASKVAK